MQMAWRLVKRNKLASAVTTVLAVVLVWGLVANFAQPRVHQGLPYAEPKNERQMLDVYVPTEGTNLPVVIWFHGGSFSAGDKKEVHRKPQAFVDKRFVFVSVNYRLLPQVRVKQIAEDAAKAIRWTHDHVNDYGGDPDRIIVMGHSAGKQLAALVCTDESYLKGEGLSFSIIKGCVPVDGFFGTGKDKSGLMPATHVGKEKNIPPFLLLHPADAPQASEAFAKLLQAAGVSARAYSAGGKDHASINEDFGKADDEATQAVWEFLEEALKK